MKITYDPAKHAKTLADRGVNFKDAVKIFAGNTIDGLDDRFDYGEKRMITVGYLNERMMVVIWTPRGTARHIISMRKANEKEQRRYRQRLG